MAHRTPPTGYPKEDNKDDSPASATIEWGPPDACCTASEMAALEAIRDFHTDYMREGDAEPRALNTCQHLRLALISRNTAALEDETKASGAYPYQDESKVSEVISTLKERIEALTNEAKEAQASRDMTKRELHIARQSHMSVVKQLRDELADERSRVIKLGLEKTHIQEELKRVLANQLSLRQSLDAKNKRLATQDAKMKQQTEKHQHGLGQMEVQLLAAKEGVVCATRKLEHQLKRHMQLRADYKDLQETMVALQRAHKEALAREAAREAVEQTKGEVADEARPTTPTPAPTPPTETSSWFKTLAW